MGATYFISDVHLTAEKAISDSKREKILLNFLDYCAGNSERLIIVGDLFDFWFEYRSVIPRGYTRIFCALARLADLGKEIHYVTGNHDFWMRDYLSSEFDINIHMDEFTLSIGEKRFYIFHGDGIAKNDHGYRFLKKIFRNKINIFLYRLIHPDIGIPLAKWVSSLSRQHTAQPDQPDDKDYLDKANHLFKNGYDYVLCGHLHFPKIKKYGKNIYINLGDWINHYTYAEYKNNQLDLKKWLP